MLDEANARYSPKWRRARINFLSPLKTLYRIRKFSMPWYFDFTPDLKKLRQLRCFSRSLLLTIAYISVIYERAMGRGEGWVEVPFIPTGWECAYIRVFKGSITGGVLKNLKATILEGKDKTFSSCSIALLHLPILQRFWVYTTQVSSAFCVGCWFGVYRLRVYQPGNRLSNSSLKRNIYTYSGFSVYIILVNRDLHVGWLAYSEWIVEPVLSGQL